MSGKPTPHGTVNGYNHYGCRCESCCQACREYYGHRPQAVVAAEREAQHGTEGRYIHRGCRCAECREASRVARARRRAGAA